MGLPGMYLQLNNTLHNRVSEKLIVPYTDKFGFSTSQEYFEPIKELFDFTRNLGKKAINSLKAGGLNSIPLTILGHAEEVKSTLDKILGTALFNKSLSAKAWKTSRPVSIGINLNLFLGMNGKWDGKEEVYNPIMNLMAKTNPAAFGNTTGSVILTPPGPSGLDAFLEFGKDLFSIDTNLKNNKISGYRTWGIAVGYSDDGIAIPNPFFSLSNLVATSSSFNFSTQLDSNGFPIEGSLRMDFTSQSLLLSSDFSKK